MPICFRYLETLHTSFVYPLSFARDFWIHSEQQQSLRSTHQQAQRMQDRTQRFSDWQQMFLPAAH